MTLKTIVDKIWHDEILVDESGDSLLSLTIRFTDSSSFHAFTSWKRLFVTKQVFGVPDILRQA